MVRIVLPVLKIAVVVPPITISMVFILLLVFYWLDVSFTDQLLFYKHCARALSIPAVP